MKYDNNQSGSALGRESKLKEKGLVECTEDAAAAVLRHVHEFEGSVELAELTEDPHNHRFAGVTGQAIIVTGGHVHEVFTRTDFYEDHFHFVDSVTELPTFLQNGKHVHLVTGFTTEAEDHMHEFQVATLLEDPLSPVATA